MLGLGKAFMGNVMFSHQIQSPGGLQKPAEFRAVIEVWQQVHVVNPFPQRGFVVSPAVQDFGNGQENRVSQGFCNRRKARRRDQSMWL